MHKQGARDSFSQKMRKMYGEIETCYRPDLRWWLAEGLNTDETLRKNVREIYESGFGAAEFLAMPEPGADSSVYGWGSEEWTNDTRLIISEVTKHGLGFSLTSGANWANANLPDTFVWRGEAYNPDNKAAAKELDYATVLVAAGEAFSGELPLPVAIKSVGGDIHGTAATFTRQVFQGVVAARVLTRREESGQAYGYAQGSGTGLLDADSLLDLTGSVREEEGRLLLDWTAPEDGEYALFVYWMHGTGQTASPSVSVNYTINYVDAYGVQAFIDYWEQHVLTDELHRVIRENGRGEIYMDSLELVTYGAGGVFWGYHFKEEFTARKGYDITPYLPFLTKNGARVESHFAKKYDYAAFGEKGAAEIQKVRDDFYSVMSDLYLENVLAPLQKWLHSLGMTLRAEPSYGMTYEISTPARYIDGIETESFAQNADVDLFRGILGSANLYGRVFSSETGAVHGHNYYFSMDDWTQLCYLQFAEGVSRTVFHGYSAIEGSEADTFWPGHEGMYARFSERFNSRQPASIHYPRWTRMLGRNQKALRQGVPARDIAILRTDYFYVNYGQPKGYDNFTKNFMMHDKAYFWQDLSLQQAGYTYDYFSPLLLEDEENLSWSGKALQPDGPAYRAVIVYQEAMELSAAKRLLQIARDGLPVLFVNNNTEILAHDGTEICHGKAASASRCKSDSDRKLAQIIAEIKALGNVAELESPAEALACLQGFGVHPRVGYDRPNGKILTMSRRDEENGVFYTFVYSYKFEVCKDDGSYSFQLDIEGEGTPWHIDDWTSEVSRLGLYEAREGRTRIPLTLKPGEAMIIALDLRGGREAHAVSTTAAEIRVRDGALFALATTDGTFETVLDSGARIRTSHAVPKPIPLDIWDIEIEDWNEGERVVNTEEKFGHTTREVYYTTKKTKLFFPASPLRPWKDLPATPEQLSALAGEDASMAHVSGVGLYTAEFELPADWSEVSGAYLCVESAGGATLEVTVNGKTLEGFNCRTRRADVGEWLQPGKNTVCIQLATTLTNRMLQRNYREKGSRWTQDFPAPQAYGLTGKVELVPYTLAAL